MAEETLETRIAKLEAKTKKIKASLQHSADNLGIINLQSLYNHTLHVTQPGRQWEEYFANKDPRIKNEVVELGPLKGIEEVKLGVTPSALDDPSAPSAWLYERGKMAFHNCIQLPSLSPPIR